MSYAVFFNMFLCLFEMLLMMFCYFQITKPMPVCKLRFFFDEMRSASEPDVGEYICQPERDEKFVFSRSDRFGS